MLTPPNRRRGRSCKCAAQHRRSAHEGIVDGSKAPSRDHAAPLLQAVRVWHRRRGVCRRCSMNGCSPSRRPGRSFSALRTLRRRRRTSSIFHGWRADTAGSVRQQAGASEVRRPGDSRGVHSERGALRVHQGHADGCSVRRSRSRRMDSRAPNSRNCCRNWRTIADDIAIVRSLPRRVQPRARDRSS
jgi:hypothetical protein